MCVGILLETFPDDPLIKLDLDDDQQPTMAVEENSHTDGPKVGRVVKNALDLPEHIQDLYTTSSEALSEYQQVRLIKLFLKYLSLFAAIDTDLGQLSAVTPR